MILSYYSSLIIMVGDNLFTFKSNYLEKVCTLKIINWVVSKLFILYEHYVCLLILIFVILLIGCKGVVKRSFLYKRNPHNIRF